MRASGIAAGALRTRLGRFSFQTTHGPPFWRAFHFIGDISCQRENAPVAINASLWSSDQAGIASGREPTGNDPFTRNNAIAPLPAASSPPRRAEHAVRRLFPGLPCEINRPKVADPSQASPRPRISRFAGCFWGSKSGEASLKMDFGGFTVVPDKEWRGMYRVRRPDGRLTNMVNLTRTRDAARCFAEQERRQQPLALAA